MAKKKKEKFEHYTPKNIILTRSLYNLIWGERSNGKTFSIKYVGLFGFHEDGVDIDGYLEQEGENGMLPVIRRWDTDFKGKNGATFYDDIINNQEEGNILKKKTRGKWNSIHYYARAWYLECIDEDTGEVIERDKNPFAVGFAINMQEHYKGNQYPQIGDMILFDEFISKFYLTDEFHELMQLLSTLIRLRDDIRIFMCANPISSYNPYFVEMGLTKAKYQKKGTIESYKYKTDTDKDLTVSVEYSDFPSKKKPSNVYFAFNNPKLKMITDGRFEIGFYPHLPFKYLPKDVIYTYFIIFDNEMYQAEIIAKDNIAFTYIHRRTKPIDHDTESVIYQQDYDERPNVSRKIARPHNDIQRFIVSFFAKEKVFYQDNEVGESISQFILWSKAQS